MASRIKILAAVGPVAADISLPSSKSISNRLLIMAALSDYQGSLRNISAADDSVLMNQLLQKRPEIMDAGNAGTVARFLMAFLCVTQGEYVLKGTGGMEGRPMAPLVDALLQLGGEIIYLEEEGRLPVRIRGRKLKGGKVSVDSTFSSQFASALMMIGPYCSNGLEITLSGSVVSGSYIRMTAGLMRQAGIDVKIMENRILIRPGGYLFWNPVVEQDWSSAAFWYEIAALRNGSSIFLKGLTLESVQGDSWCANLFRPLGIDTIQEKEGIRITNEESLLNKVVPPADLKNHPDLVMPYAAALAGRRMKGVISGIGSLRYKETDRITALLNELSKVGAMVEVRGEAMEVKGGDAPEAMFQFEGYEDHRMVMSLAPLCLVSGGVEITTPDSVSKSYPSYFDQLVKAGFSIY